jgi:predicted phosphodiesterase
VCDHGGKSGTCISPLTREKDLTRLHARRLKKLKTVQKIFGERIEAMAPEQALELIREVNGLMEKECYRPANKAGKPGGLIEIPDDKLPIIVGDLHTRLDNLLVVLTQNAFLDELQSGNAVLVILGDAVHSEVEGELDQMETSMLIMDFIFRLKLRFPEQVFYLRGNHDSFSADMSKQGVPQGILWRKLLKRDRGKAYLEEMQRYYDQLPYIACSRHFVCCHAGPPTFEVNREDLINLHDDGRLMGELTKNRIRTSSRLTGYSKADIKRLRKVLGVDQDTCLIVGHTPLSNDDTLWMNPCDSKNHCKLYTGGEEWVGVMSLVGDRMLPFRYPVESLLALLDKE